MKWSLQGTGALLALALCGCGSGSASSETQREGGMGPVVHNAKEEYEEKKMAEVTRGLSFGTGRVTVTVRRPSDRAAAVKACEAAEKSLVTENSWWVCAGKFRDAILLDPSYAPSYEGMARAFLLEGNVTKAETAVKTAVAKDPTFSKAEFLLGTITQMNGDFTGAVAVWKTLVQHDPSYPDAFARMAVCSYFANDFKSAYQYLAEADKRKQNVPSQFRPLLKEAAQRP